MEDKLTFEQIVAGLGTIDVYCCGEPDELRNKRRASQLALADETIVSVQASEGHYCTPRDNTGPYTTVELLIIGQQPDWPDHPGWPCSIGTNYGFVPVELVRAFIVERGGEVR